MALAQLGSDNNPHYRDDDPQTSILRHTPTRRRCWLSPYVRDEVRQKVLRAADTLEYRPLHHARHMRTQRSKVFGFLERRHRHDTFCGSDHSGAQEAAWQREMLLLTFNTDGRSGNGSSGHGNGVERGVEGHHFRYHVPPSRAGAERCLRLPLVLVDCFARIARSEAWCRMRSAAGFWLPNCSSKRASSHRHDQRRSEIPCCGWAFQRILPGA